MALGQALGISPLVAAEVLPELEAIAVAAANDQLMRDNGDG